MNNTCKQLYEVMSKRLKEEFTHTHFFCDDMITTASLDKEDTFVSVILQYNDDKTIQRHREIGFLNHCKSISIFVTVTKECGAYNEPEDIFEASSSFDTEVAAEYAMQMVKALYM